MTADETSGATTTAVEVKSEKIEQKVVKMSYNPQEQPVEWLQQIGKGPAKKVAYQVLSWLNTATGQSDKPVPGKAEAQETSTKDFMSYLKDGQLLAKLGNVLQPGSIETVHEEQDKDKQTDNIKNFLNVVKDKFGVTAADNVKPEDVQAGKTSQFGGLLGTLVQLAGQQGAIDPENLIKIVQEYVKKGFVQQVQQLLQRVFKKSPSSVEQKKAAEENGAEKSEMKKQEIIIEEAPKIESTPAVEAN